MQTRHDLASLDWSLTGWHPGYWRPGTPMEQATIRALDPDVGPIPARVPGSVHAALRAQGVLPDWNVQLNSRQCEWVEHRDWKFEALLPARWTKTPGRKVLYAEGLDYTGFVVVNGREAGRFCGTFTPHRFDLTPFLKAKGANRLAVVFTTAPSFLGQIGHTSAIHEWKPRFNYVWDWVPRTVSVGIWDRLSLDVETEDGLRDLSVYADYEAATGIGRVHFRGEVAAKRGRRLLVRVEQGRRLAASRQFAASARPRGVVEAGRVAPWHPNGNGPRALYTVRVQLLDARGAVLDEAVRPVGFRQIAWKPCRGASRGATPWVCAVNGVDTFLQGFNWVPMRPNFADVTEAEYRRRLETYRDLGTNVLRVWGGGPLEPECFYRLCDELGILVWQEFPLSSSGCDNSPPRAARPVAEMRAIAASYVRRRQHHPSLLLWCGGNELSDVRVLKDCGGRPLDTTHPMLRAQQQVVRALDPTRRFVPTSPSGPRFYALASNFGKGVHHDVHGPWNHAGALDGWFDYWDRDDAMFRSEVGMPGAGPARLIRRFGGDMALPMDKTNPYWVHAAAWWVQARDYRAQGGDPRDLDAYVAWSQRRQAVALGYAARACKRRFPACGGFIVWMGHDCFPCPANTAVIDFEGRLKPAARALRAVFRAAIAP